MTEWSRAIVLLPAVGAIYIPLVDFLNRSTVLQHPVDNCSMHVCEPELPSLKAVCQPFVIQAEAMKDGRLQIVDVNRILCDVEGKIIGLAVNEAGFYAATRQPH